MASRAVHVTQDAKSRFLEGLEAGELKSILGAAARLQISTNSFIVRQGEAAQQIFLLVEGGARFSYFSPEGHTIVGPQIVPGDIIGGAALLQQPVSYLYSTEAVRDSRLLAWDRTTIRALLARHPRLMDNALCIAFDYIDSALIAHIHLVCDNARARVAQTLVDLTRSTGRKGRDGVELHLTNEELANAANVTVFTASRLMSEWHRRGALVKSRGKVRLRHPDRLFSPAI